MKYSVRNKVLALVAAVTLVAVVLVGILLSGGGNGYDVLMKALRKHIFETKNVTEKTEVVVKIDGAVAYEQSYEYKLAGDDTYTKTSGMGFDKPDEKYTVGGVTYLSIDAETKQYSQYKHYGNLRGFLPDDSDIGTQLFDIGEMLTNLAAGSAKNLIVNFGTKDGETTYSINMAESQFPQIVEAIVNLADSTMKAEAANEYNLGVKYEDYDEAFKSFYKQKTGSDLDELVFERYGADKELRQAYYDMQDEMSEHYKAMLASKPESKILFVPVSGEPVYYADYAEYCLSGNERADIEVNGEGLCVKGFNVTGVKGDARVDSEGRLTHVNVVASVDLFDYADKVHATEIALKVDLSDYGTTVVALPDLSEYTDRAVIAREESVRYEEKTYTIDFNGKTYDITVQEAVETATEEVE